MTGKERNVYQRCFIIIIIIIIINITVIVINNIVSLSLSLLLKTQIFEVTDRRPFEIKFVIGIIYPRGRRVHAPVYCQYIPCLPLNSLYLSFHHSSDPWAIIEWHSLHSILFSKNSVLITFFLFWKGFRHGFGMHAQFAKYLWPSTLFTNLTFPRLHLVNLLTIFFSWFLLRTAHYTF